MASDPKDQKVSELISGIQDFETENLIAHYKFKLTNWTLKSYEAQIGA